jgi:hypothetical protein
MAVLHGRLADEHEAEAQKLEEQQLTEGAA